MATHQLPATVYTYGFYRAVKYVTLRLTAVPFLLSPSQDPALISYPPSLLHFQTPSQCWSTALFIRPHPTECCLFVLPSLPSAPFSLPPNRCLPRVNTVPTSPKPLLIIANVLFSQSQSNPIPTAQENFFLKTTSTHPSLTTWSHSWPFQPYHQVLSHHLLLDGKDNVTDKGQGSTPSVVTDCFVGYWKRQAISLGLFQDRGPQSTAFIEESLKALLPGKDSSL